MSDNIIDINERIVKEFINQTRPPAEVRAQVDFGYSYDNGIIELFEIRPNWRYPKVIENFSFARIKYVKTQKIWKLFWLRASGKWESYEPFPESSNLEKLLTIIEEDAKHCFKG